MGKKSKALKAARKALKAPAPPRRLVSRTYRAPVDRGVEDGFMPIRSTSMEAAPSALPMIRARARDLAHNNPHAARAIQILTSHHIGKGIRSSVKGDPEFERYLTRWSRSSACDYERRLNYFGLQSVMARAMFEAGDAFAILRDDVIDGRLTVTIQLIDADQLDEGAMPTDPDHAVTDGVETDLQGRIYGYHVRETAERFGRSLGVDRSHFVHVDNMIHIFETVYPGQVRGIPRGAQALVRAAINDDIMVSVATKVRNESSFTGISKSKSADNESGIVGEMMGGSGGRKSGASLFGNNVDIYDDGSREAQIVEMIEPGTVMALPEDADFTQLQITSPVGAIDYLRVSMQSVAVSYGVTYYHISGDTGGLNFSTNKAERIEFNRAVDTTREHTFFPQFEKINARVRRVFELEFWRQVDADIRLISPARETMEPEKDAAAQMIHLKAGGLTWSSYCLSLGLDPEEQIAEIKREREMIRDAEVDIHFSDVNITLDASEQDDQGGFRPW